MFGNRSGAAGCVMHPQDQMPVHGERVVAELFRSRQIPMRVQPVRIAYRQVKFGQAGADHPRGPRFGNGRCRDPFCRGAGLWKVICGQKIPDFWPRRRATARLDPARGAHPEHALRGCLLALFRERGGFSPEDPGAQALWAPGFHRSGGACAGFPWSRSFSGGGRGRPGFCTSWALGTAFFGGGPGVSAPGPDADTTGHRPGDWEGFLSFCSHGPALHENYGSRLRPESGACNVKSPTAGMVRSL